jgi:hypothetical protein
MAKRPDTLYGSRPPQTRLGRWTVARDGATVTSDALTSAPFPTASPQSWASTAGLSILTGLLPVALPLSGAAPGKA